MYTFIVFTQLGYHLWNMGVDYLLYNTAPFSTTPPSLENY